jgi:hypothetical protein
VHVWCYWRRVLSLWRAPRPTAVSAVWRSMCYTRSACTGDSAATGLVTSLFFVIMAANGATMYFFTLFVLRPSSFVASFVVHRPIFWGAYFSSSVTSQPQYASRELQIVRDPTRRNIACSSHPRTRQCNALKWLCRETTPKGACEGHDHYPEVGTSIRKRLCHSQDHFVRRFMFTPVGEHPQGY